MEETNQPAYELKSARYLAREVLLRAVRPGDRVVDATMGNGHDTLFLCETVGSGGHVYAFRHVSEPVQAVVFNLGWLPGGRHEVTTRWETTREAVLKALDLLRPMGVLVLCAYPGHAEGARELQELIGLFSGLSNREYNVLHQRFLNAGPGAPECFVIQKQL